MQKFWYWIISAIWRSSANRHMWGTQTGRTHLRAQRVLNPRDHLSGVKNFPKMLNPAVNAGAPSPAPAQATTHGETMGRINVRAPARPAMHASAKSGDLAELTRAIELIGSDIDKKHLGYSPLHLAAKGGHCEAVKLLLDSGSDLHGRASNGTTALHCAAENNRTEMIALLLNLGSDLHAKAHGDDTVLHYAALNGRLAATKLLVAKGADVHATNQHGVTPCEDAVQLGRGRCPCEDPTAREWVAVAAFLERVMPMDEASRVEFAMCACKRPEAAVLHDAAELGNLGQLARLLENGGDVDAPDYDGSTAIHAAVEGGHLKAVALLLDARADVRATNNYQDSALHLAAREGHLPIARLLVAKGADVHAKNRFGATPIEYASRKQNGEWEAVVAFLEGEMKDMSELSPADRALRKVRLSLLEQQRAMPLRYGRPPSSSASSAAPPRVSAMSDVSAAPARPIAPSRKQGNATGPVTGAARSRGTIGRQPLRWKQASLPGTPADVASEAPAAAPAPVHTDPGGAVVGGDGPDRSGERLQTEGSANIGGAAPIS